jgi:hypothetical protein
LRSGGGIGDIMKPPEWDDSDFKYRVFYDSSFFFLVIIILLNIIFGIIIDTFGGKRSSVARAAAQNFHSKLLHKIFGTNLLLWYKSVAIFNFTMLT